MRGWLKLEYDTSEWQQEGTNFCESDEKTKATKNRDGSLDVWPQAGRLDAELVFLLEFKSLSLLAATH